MLSNVNAGDTAWILFCAALVFLMVPGLAFFFGGLLGKKHTASILRQSFMAVCWVSLQWVLFGYSLSFGPDHNGWIGTLARAGLRGVGAEPSLEYAGLIPHAAFMLYHAMIALIAPVVLLCAFADRLKFSSVCWLTLLWTTLVYDPVAHWVWGVGGFLRNSGVLDFGGGTVVMLSAGVSALAMSLVLGKSPESSAAAPPSSDSSFTVLGAALLWLGWFGFNGGHALTSGGQTANTIVATHTAAVTAALVWSVLDGIFYEQVSLIGLLTGAITGLAAITPAAGFVGLWGALGIGSGACAIVYVSFVLLEKRFGYGSALLTFCVFGIGGIFGTLCSGPLAVQAKGALAVSLYSFGMSYFLLKIMDYVIGLRPSEPSAP